MTVLAVAVIGLGIRAFVATNETEDIDVATRLMDDFNAGWNANDPETIVAVFAEDGTSIDSGGRSPSGEDELLIYADYDGGLVAKVERTGEPVATGSGTFTAPVQFVAGYGRRR